MKSEDEEWTKKEMLDTAFSTVTEWHTFVINIALGMSEGHKFKYDANDPELAYAAAGWSIGEIIERIMNNNPDDTKIAIAQSLGIFVKYAIVGLMSVGAFNIFG